MQNHNPIEYTPGMFDAWKEEPNFELWDRFAETMWGLGFDMDCYHSFEDYQKSKGFDAHPGDETQQGRRKLLYALEHADKQIVGNYLFSNWRYYTHWSYGWDKYEPDFMQRVLTILETKMETQNPQTVSAWGKGHE